jgi:hypothetical protein
MPRFSILLKLTKSSTVIKVLLVHLADEECYSVSWNKKFTKSTCLVVLPMLKFFF